MSTPRPRSVTLACVYGGLGGVLATVALYEALAGWGSIEVQEALRQGLEPLGADPDAVLPTLRWVVMALLVGSIAATVFSFFTARGHQSSRIGLSVLAGLGAAGFLATGVAGLLPAILGLLIVYLLWTAPAREWFAVMNGRTPLSLGTAPSVPSAPTPFTPAGQPGAPGQPAQPGQPVQPPPYDPAQHATVPQPGALPPGGRPRPVGLALLISGIAYLVGALGSGVVLLALVALRDEVTKQYEQNDLLQRQLDSAGITAGEMVTLGTWLFGGWLVISLLGLGATAWAASGAPTGWWALVVVSVVTAGFAALGLPVGLVWILGAIVVIVQLSRPEAKAWFRRA
ncbi:hypothetical protein [Aeromicrobium choanae]|uniref:Uncharacterized protein n=1 Tax=Aeromicrobium choanae TaxID=1736691 RepID=A0A1T4Z1C8_9ACTN|nr:hypothetical protein [Aeromicrobium choanae]SKB07847.1 hypothetical protein SAMN06295964_1871 [Aeromicrobium choanae]